MQIPPQIAQGIADAPPVVGGEVGGLGHGGKCIGPLVPGGLAIEDGPWLAELP